MEENNNLYQSTHERKISKKTMNKVINHQNDSDGKNYYIINNDHQKGSKQRTIELLLENTSNKEKKNINLATKKNKNAIKTFVKVRKKQSQGENDIYEFPNSTCSSSTYNPNYTISKINNKKNILFDKMKPKIINYQDDNPNVQNVSKEKLLNNADDIQKKYDKQNKSVNKTQSTNNINSNSYLNDTNYCNENSLNNLNSILEKNSNSKKKNVIKRNIRGCLPEINSLNLADMKNFSSFDRNYNSKTNVSEGGWYDEHIKDILQKDNKIKNLPLTNYLVFKNQKNLISKIKSDKNNNKNSNNFKNTHRNFSKNNRSNIHININNTCLSNNGANNNMTLSNNKSNILNRNSTSSTIKKTNKSKLKKKTNKYGEYKLISDNIKISGNWSNLDQIENINLDKTKNLINKTSFTYKKNYFNSIPNNYRYTQNCEIKEEINNINNCNSRRNYEKHDLADNNNEKNNNNDDKNINEINSETIDPIHSLKIKLNKINNKLLESDHAPKRFKKLKNTTKNDINSRQKGIFTSRENKEDHNELNSINETMDNSIQKRITTKNFKKKIPNEKNKLNEIKQIKKILTSKFHTSKKDKNFSTKLNEFSTKERISNKTINNSNISQDGKDNTKEVITIHNSSYTIDEEIEGRFIINDKIYDNNVTYRKSYKDNNNQKPKKLRKSYKYIQTIYSILSHNKLLNIFCQFYDNKELTKFSLLTKKIYYFLKPFIYEKIRLYISKINNSGYNSSYNIGTKFFCNPIKKHLLNFSSLSNLSPVMLQTFYMDLLYEINEEYDVLIKKDLTRTLPGNISFEYGNSNYNKLYHILSAYSNYNKKIGYVQGLNFLAAHCLYIFKSEVESFEFLDAIIQKFNLEKLFGVQTKELDLKLFNISQELKKYTPNVNKYLQNINLNYDYFTCNWMLTLFSNSMDVKYLLYVWDFMIVFGWKFFNCFVIAVFEINQNIILNTKISEMTNLMKNILKNNKFEKQFDEIIIRSFEHLIENNEII